MNEKDVHKALDELRAVLPFALARDLRRAELVTIQQNDPFEAMRLGESEGLGGAIMYREATYVFDPTKLKWFDADKAFAQKARRQIKARKRQTPTQVVSATTRRRKPKRKH